MKRNYLKVSSWLCMLLAGMIGCTENGKNTIPAPEYGTPYAEFSFSGKVIDKDGKPIQGIEVSQENEDSDNPAVLTDKNGEYSLEHKAIPTQTYNLRFKDIDGETNGSFETALENIEIKEADFTGEEKGWFKGYVKKTVNVTMKETADNAE